jgi:hypothetical protein
MQGQASDRDLAVQALGRDQEGQASDRDLGDLLDLTDQAPDLTDQAPGLMGAVQVHMAGGQVLMGMGQGRMMVLGLVMGHVAVLEARALLSAAALRLQQHGRNRLVGALPTPRHLLWPYPAVGSEGS